MCKKKKLCLWTMIVFSILITDVFATKISSEEKKVLEKIEKYIEVNSILNVKKKFGLFLKSIAAPISAKQCKDGTYNGESIYDNYKYKHIIKIEIKDEVIVSVKYDEIKRTGSRKSKDKKYNIDMKEGSGSAPSEAYPIYQEQFQKTQDLMKIDAVSGATYSLYRFRTAAIRALLKAKI